MKQLCKFILILFFIIAPKILLPQDRKVIELTLEKAIKIAQQNSPMIMQAKNSYLVAYWSYYSYKASNLPSLSLTSNPDWINNINKITQSDGSNLFLHQNQLNNNVMLSVSQRIWFTGGTFSVNSRLVRLDDFIGETTRYQSSPIEVAYQQPLLGYNSMKWDRNMYPIRFKMSKKEYNVALEEVAKEACHYFYNLAIAQTNLDIATSNYATADTLHRYAKGRYNIGTITENEMLQLEIKKLSEEVNKIDAKVRVEDVMHSYLSFLGIKEDVELKLKLDNNIPLFTVPVEDAVRYAYNNNPLLERNELARLESKKQLEYAKASQRLNTDFFVKFGLSQASDKILNVYNNPTNQLYVSIGISIPILDWGKGKAQINIAQSNIDLVETRVNQEIKDFTFNVRRTVNKFNLQSNYVNIAAKTNTIAERRFDIAKRLYLQGNSTILDLNSAIAEKDSNIRNYVQALSEYWQLYYKIRSLTGYDFKNNQKIEDNLPDK